nr:tail fiber protein [Pedobacter sp. ASV2]
MKKIIIFLALILCYYKGFSQVTPIAPPTYKNIRIQNLNSQGDYTRCLILLHEAYAGTIIGNNHAIGTLIAMRGSAVSWNRLNVAEINTSSAYDSNAGSVNSVYNNAVAWKLMTCIYKGKKYLALDVPYQDSYHDFGYHFTGWTQSTGENMLAVAYEFAGQPLNQDVLSNIENFVPNQTEVYDASVVSISGDVGIGTTVPKEKLSVNGKIRAHEVKVEISGWPDYVFKKDYSLPSLEKTEQYIKEKGYLPGMPSAKEVELNGLELGEMNKRLLQKVEEITLYMIEMKKENAILKQDVQMLKSKINKRKL